MYKWQQIKSMRAEGVSIKKIAERLKLSKNTVKKYIRSPHPPELKDREYEKILDGYEEKIEGMLEKRYIGTRIYNELKVIGYEGSLATVHRYLQQQKGEERRSKEITTRVETAPGEQMQYDWKEWYLPVGGKRLKIYIHEVLLSYSRKKYYTYSLSIKGADVIRAIEEGIHFFGGVSREVVIDNPNQMVINHEGDGVVRYNDEFLLFCGMYGLEPNPCKNYRARTKGKVERPFYYVQEHLLRGLAVEELSEFDVGLKGLTDSYNARPHSKLKESPNERFERERPYLRALPLVEPTRLHQREPRKVSNDGYVSYNGGFYPVSMSLCLREVMVESVFGRLLRVYNPQGVMVSEHELNLFESGLRPDHPEHEELNACFIARKQARKSELVRAFIDTFKDNGEVYVEGLKERVGFNLYWHLKEILKYTQLYEISQISDALGQCIEIGAYHKNSVKRLLSAKTMPRPSVEPVLNGPNPLAVDINRGLSSYRMEVGHE